MPLIPARVLYCYTRPLGGYRVSRAFQDLHFYLVALDTELWVATCFALSFWDLSLFA
jgi:hypothetical protein